MILRNQSSKTSERKIRQEEELEKVRMLGWLDELRGHLQT